MLSVALTVARWLLAVGCACHTTKQCRGFGFSVRNVGWELAGLAELIEEANVLGGYPEPWRGPVVFAELRLRAGGGGGGDGGGGGGVAGVQSRL